MNRRPFAEKTAAAEKPRIVRKIRSSAADAIVSEPPPPEACYSFASRDSGP
jgi:hypothetical protein